MSTKKHQEAVRYFNLSKFLILTLKVILYWQNLSHSMCVCVHV